MFPQSPIQALKRHLNFQHLWTGLVGSCHPEHPNLNLHKCNLYWNPSQLVGLDMHWGLGDQTQIHHFFLGPSRISQDMPSTHACLLEHLAKGWDQNQHTEWSIPIQKKHFPYINYTYWYVLIEFKKAYQLKWFLPNMYHHTHHLWHFLSTAIPAADSDHLLHRSLQHHPRRGWASTNS